MSLQQDWIVLADMDERQVYPVQSIARFLQQMDSKGYNAVTGVLKDRVTRS